MGAEQVASNNGPHGINNESRDYRSCLLVRLISRACPMVQCLLSPERSQQATYTLFSPFFFRSPYAGTRSSQRCFTLLGLERDAAPPPLRLLLATCQFHPLSVLAAGQEMYGLGGLGVFAVHVRRFFSEKEGGGYTKTGKQDLRCEASCLAWDCARIPRDSCEHSL